MHLPFYVWQRKHIPLWADFCKRWAFTDTSSCVTGHVSIDSKNALSPFGAKPFLKPILTFDSSEPKEEIPLAYFILVRLKKKKMSSYTEIHIYSNVRNFKI